ncbi:MAG: hypothetical protein QOG06_1574, partial [Gaiellaceae bacterium]|nr:hypothetical protein [Gaiellaceae bacterium]
RDPDALTRLADSRQYAQKRAAG